MKKIKDKKKFIITSSIVGFFAIAILAVVILSIPTKPKEVKQSNDRNENLRQVEIIADYINIRSEKNVTSTILGKVNKGEIYTIISEDTNSTYKWIEIQTNNNIHGYISGNEEYVKILDNNNIDNNETVPENNEETKPEENTNKQNNNNQSNNNETKVEEQTTNAQPVYYEEKTNTPQEVTTNPENNKKIVSATISYSCNSPAWEYNSSKHTCTYESYNNDYREIKCPTDYEYKQGQCTLVNKLPDLEVNYQKTCQNGQGDLFQDGNTLRCRNGSVITQKICPSGYTIKTTSTPVGNVERCVDSRSYITKSQTVCTNGYEVTSTGICHKTIVQDAKKNYKCPDNYTLKDDKCYEN